MWELVGEWGWSSQAFTERVRPQPQLPTKAVLLLEPATLRGLGTSRMEVRDSFLAYPATKEQKGQISEIVQVKEKEPHPEECTVCDPLIKFEISNGGGLCWGHPRALLEAFRLWV